jgi:predicted nucleic acid-binding protein
MPRLQYEKVYCDTNAVIHAIENFSMSSGDLLRAAGRGDVTLYTSQLTLHELLIRPMAKEQHDLIDRYKTAMADSDTFNIVEPDVDVMVCAAELRAISKRLDLADAIHIASAMVTSCSFLISEDREMDLYLPEEIERLTLDELSEEMGYV